MTRMFENSMGRGSFTFLVSDIIQYYGDGAVDIYEQAKNAGRHIFQNYPIWNESHRDELNQKILLAYYDYEIGQETVGAWKLHMNADLFRIMPYYNALALTQIAEIDGISMLDVLNDVDYNDIFSRSTEENFATAEHDSSRSEENSEKTMEGQSSGTSNLTGKKTGTDDTTTTGSNDTTVSGTETKSGTTNGTTEGTSTTESNGTSTVHSENENHRTMLHSDEPQVNFASGEYAADYASVLEKEDTNGESDSTTTSENTDTTTSSTKTTGTDTVETTTSTKTTGGNNSTVKGSTSQDSTEETTTSDEESQVTTGLVQTDGTHDRTKNSVTDRQEGEDRKVKGRRGLFSIPMILKDLQKTIYNIDNEIIKDLKKNFMGLML